MVRKEQADEREEKADDGTLSIRRIDRYSQEFEVAANRLARDYCPRIIACRHCSWPVIQGFCCRTCDSNDP